MKTQNNTTHAPDTGDLGMVAMFIRSSAYNLAQVVDSAIESGRVNDAVTNGYPFNSDLENVVAEMLAWAERIDAQARA